MVSLRRIAVLVAVSTAFALPIAAAPAAKADVIVVPPGNRSQKQPKIYSGSRLLTAMRNTGSFNDKYQRVYAVFANNPKLVARIKQVSARYGIDPIHVIGAIVGEHTYNIDTFDTLQDYYVKALQYAGNTTLTFSYKGQTAAQLFAMPQFAKCEQMKNTYEKWDCRQTVWNRQFMGKFVNGKLYTKDRLHRVFFKPAFGGQTFGFGQLSPVAALMVTDVTHSKAGLPLLSIDDPSQVYEQIMSPDTSLDYVAANIRVEIDMYKQIAGFDISQNPGITATLYNLGDAATRARELKAENDQRISQGKAPVYPQENFYGWLVNDKEAELRALVN
jgi:Protein of unknown function (DUF1402)